jgi:hypothetical protein
MSRGEAGRTDTTTLGRIVDWGVSGLLAFAGLVVGVLGLLVNASADRAAIADLVRQGTIESGTLTDAELVDVTYALLWWGGVGLALAGLLALGGGVGFFLYRRRRSPVERVDPTAEVEAPTRPDSVTTAVAGGAVTIVTSFVPFSPLLGGAVAGYLDGGGRRAGARAGALAGLVALVPLAVVFLFLLGATAVVASELGLGVAAVAAGLALLVGLVVAGAYTVGLSALGGYLVVRFNPGGAVVGEDTGPT